MSSVPVAGPVIPVLDCTAITVFKVVFNRTKDWADIEAVAERSPGDIEKAATTLAELAGEDDPAYRRLDSVRASSLSPGASRLVDRGEAALEAVAGGAQVEAPDADPLWPRQADRLVEVLVQAPYPVAQRFRVVGAELFDMAGDEARPLQRQRHSGEV